MTCCEGLRMILNSKVAYFWTRYVNSLNYLCLMRLYLRSGRTGEFGWVCSWTLWESIGIFRGRIKQMWVRLDWNSTFPLIVWWYSFGEATREWGKSKDILGLLLDFTINMRVHGGYSYHVYLLLDESFFLRCKRRHFWLGHWCSSTFPSGLERLLSSLLSQIAFGPLLSQRFILFSCISISPH